MRPTRAASECVYSVRLVRKEVARTLDIRAHSIVEAITQALADNEGCEVFGVWRQTSRIARAARP